MKALILTDLQNDFCPGGALAVAGGDEAVAAANRLAGHFPLVVATQDWHPPDHASFAANHPGRQVGDVVEVQGLPQILWPVHCVQNTPGAEFHPDLGLEPIARIFRKGTQAQVDSYSAFFDNARRGDTGLHAYLQAAGVAELWVVGLATDYCVRYTVLDAVALGYRVGVVAEACRGVNVHPGDVDRVYDELRRAGVQIRDETRV